MAEDRIREMRGDRADIKERTPKVPNSDVRNETRQPVNISSKNGTMSVSISTRDAHIKAQGPVQTSGPDRYAIWQSIGGGHDQHSQGTRNPHFLPMKYYIPMNGSTKVVGACRFLICLSEKISWNIQGILEYPRYQGI
jgi:hypothetical protein